MVEFCRPSEKKQGFQSEVSTVKSLVMIESANKSKWHRPTDLIFNSILDSQQPIALKRRSSEELSGSQNNKDAFYLLGRIGQSKNSPP